MTDEPASPPEEPGLPPEILLREREGDDERFRRRVRLEHAKVCRRAGRFCSAAIVLPFALLVTAVPHLHPNARNPAELMNFFLLFAYIEGLILAWAWELPGGLVALAVPGFVTTLGLSASHHADVVEFLLFLAIAGTPPSLFVLSAVFRRPAADPESQADAPSTGDKIATVVATLVVAAVFGLSF